MRALRSRVLVALDQSGVAAAAVSGALSAPRIRSFACAPLGPGALRPGPLDPNLARPREVEEALAQVAREVEGGRGPVSLILPEGVARTVLLDVPPGVDARDFARYRLAAQAGNGGAPRLRVVGPGAAALRRAWRDGGRDAEPGWSADGGLPVDAAELAWLGGALGR